MYWDRLERAALILSIAGGFLAIAQFSSKDSFLIVKNLQIVECDKNSKTNGHSSLIQKLIAHDKEIVFLKNIEISPYWGSECRGKPNSIRTDNNFSLDRFILIPDKTSQKAHPRMANTLYLSMPKEEPKSYIEVNYNEGASYRITGPVRVRSSWGEGDLYFTLENVDVEKGLYSHYSCSKKKASAYRVLAIAACLF